MECRASGATVGPPVSYRSQSIDQSAKSVMTGCRKERKEKEREKERERLRERGREKD